MSVNRKRLEIIFIPANNCIAVLLQLVWLVSYLFYVTTKDRYLDKTEQVLVDSGC